MSKCMISCFIEFKDLEIVFEVKKYAKTTNQVPKMDGRLDPISFFL